jgi:hypothetical protein
MATGDDDAVHGKPPGRPEGKACFDKRQQAGPLKSPGDDEVAVTVRWYCLRTAPGALAFLAESDMEAFLRGHCPLPADEAQLVHYVGLNVTDDRGTIMGIESAWFARCPVHPNGWLDQQAMLDRARARVDLHRRLTTQGVAWPPGQDVIDARDAFAARRVQNETRWDPTEEDLTALRKLINDRAGWSVL